MNKVRLKEIYNIIHELTFSEDAFLDVIKYLDEAIIIANANKDVNCKGCLSNLLQTRDKQLSYMKDNYNKSNYEERKSYFNDLKDNFIIDLDFWCCNDEL